MNDYLRRFVNCKSAENLMGIFSRCRKPAKEITESWGMLEAAKRFVPDLDSFYVLVIGDGYTPRTGALFAYFTKADVVSIDPELREDWWDDHKKKQAALGLPVKRLNLVKAKIEDIPYTTCLGKPLLVLWPHSHANMNKLNVANFSKRIDIAMPCCEPIPANWMRLPHIAYDDHMIASPKRRVHIWGVLA